MIESRQRDVLASDGIATALDGLDERSRRIVESAGSRSMTMAAAA
jgi:RNA polymerase sigma-32 factor